MDSENHFRLQLIIEYPVSNYKFGWLDWHPQMLKKHQCFSKSWSGWVSMRKYRRRMRIFSHAVTGLNPSSWIDFLFQLSRAGLHTYATSTGKLCFSKPNQSIWNLAQERDWLTQGPTSQHKVVSSAPSYPPTLGVSLLNHSNGRCKQSLKFTSPLSDVSTMSTSKHQKFLQCSKRTFHPCMSLFTELHCQSNSLGNVWFLWWRA